jgi:hypothetical protein
MSAIALTVSPVNPRVALLVDELPPELDVLLSVVDAFAITLVLFFSGLVQATPAVS